MPASLCQTSSQYASPAGLDGPNWPLINEELATMLRPLHSELANDIITPSTAAEEFSILVNAHLDHHLILKKPSTLSASPIANDYNRERTIVRLTKRLARVKNQSRRSFPHNPPEFLNAVRVHHKAKKAADRLVQQRSARKQEKAFRKNP